MRSGTSELRIYPDDARDLIDQFLPPYLKRSFYYFRSLAQKAPLIRRYISIENLDALARVMVVSFVLPATIWNMSGGHFSMYASMGHLNGREDGARLAERPSHWPATRYELKALAEGRSCIYLRFRRRKRAWQT